MIRTPISNLDLSSLWPILSCAATKTQSEFISNPGLDPSLIWAKKYSTPLPPLNHIHHHKWELRKSIAISRILTGISFTFNSEISWYESGFGRQWRHLAASKHIYFPKSTGFPRGWMRHGVYPYYRKMSDTIMDCKLLTSRALQYV